MRVEASAIDTRGSQNSGAEMEALAQAVAEESNGESWLTASWRPPGRLREH